MSEQTPSQAEGEQQQKSSPDDTAQTPEHPDVPRTTPSQAEGEEPQDEEETEAWESGWSGP
ncbi:hypothetical protein ACIOKD_12145 [Streptomyces sp. NPDC087844]|uniref:hypothetical protein n=1 Tax=Streptomyces sp. NPDC087844 TaxID=3365805 RepID=UPI00382D1C66